MIAGLLWQIRIYPNGNDTANEGSFDVFLKLLTLATEWNHIFIRYMMRCVETNSSSTACGIYFNTNGNVERGWIHNAMSFDEIQNLKHITIIIHAKLLNIILKDNKTILYHTTLTNQITNKYLEWNIDPKLFLQMKQCKNGKQFESPLFYDLFSLQIYPNGWKKENEGKCHIVCAFCGLPKLSNTIQMKIKWNLKLILKGGKDKTLNTEYTADLVYEDGNYWIWGERRRIIIIF